jgi:hypothetical protein
MYCSSCGAESIQGLQYCKRCGANLNPIESLASTRKPKGLVWIVAFGLAMMMGVPLGGIAVVLERIPPLLQSGFPLWFLTALTIMSLLMMSTALVLLSRLLSPIFKTYLESSDAAAGARPKLTVPIPAQISAPNDSIVSVTEDTTRVFEPLRREPDPH